MLTYAANMMVAAAASSEEGIEVVEHHQMVIDDYHTYALVMWDGSKLGKTIIVGLGEV